MSLAAVSYAGPCRQLTLLEPGPGGNLTPVLQVLTSDPQTCAPDLLLTLKGRWIIENTFKYLGRPITYQLTT